MGHATCPGAGIGQLAGILLQILNQLLHRLGRHLFGIYHQHHRCDDEQRNRRKIRHRIVRKITAQRPQCGVRGRRRIEQRVTVGRLPDYIFAGDGSGRADAVVNHDRLVPALADGLRQQSHDDVARSARRKRYDDLHRACRKRRCRLLGRQLLAPRRRSGARRDHAAKRSGPCQPDFHTRTPFPSISTDASLSPNESPISGSFRQQLRARKSDRIRG